MEALVEQFAAVKAQADGLVQIECAANVSDDTWSDCDAELLLHLQGWTRLRLSVGVSVAPRSRHSADVKRMSAELKPLHFRDWTPTELDTVEAIAKQLRPDLIVDEWEQVSTELVRGLPSALPYSAGLCEHAWYQRRRNELKLRRRHMPMHPDLNET